MIKPFEEKTRLRAWLAATEYLLDVDSTLNITLSITEPSTDGTVSKGARSAADRFLASENEAPLHTVAETIFPGWEYRHRGLEGVFEKYKEEYEVFKRGDGRWGTYAFRLVHRQTATGAIVNPLKNLIEKMRVEAKTPGPKKSCYEIGVAEGAYDLPLYNTVDDNGRHLGGPCLSHLSFKLFEGRVHLTAVYRSHDYRYKALGNMLGLARLQACVSEQVGIPMGELVIHSTYAYIHKSKTALRSLVNEIRAIESTEI